MASTPVRLLSLLGAALLATGCAPRHSAETAPEDVRFQTETLLTGLPQPMHLPAHPRPRNDRNHRHQAFHLLMASQGADASEHAW